MFRRYTLILFALLPFVAAAQVATNRPERLDLLQKAANTINLDSLCALPYTPYRPYSDRAYWDSLPSVVRTQAIHEAEKSIDYVWRTVSLTSYLEFSRSGTRQPNDRHIGERHQILGKLLLGELVEGKGRFIDAIANGVWSLCEQSTWVATAHISLQGSGRIPDIDKRAIDLSSGETANTLAWTLYFLNEQLTKLSPTLTKRLSDELDRHILSVYLERNDLWWMATNGGFTNNWNVWCNFNVLTTALLVEKDPARRAAIMRKSLRSVDQFINYFKADGGCEEGPAYWGHAGGKLLEYGELVRDYSDGEINIFTDQKVKNIGLYIARAHIDSLYFVNFADAGAKNHPLPDIIYRYGAAMNDTTMMQFGAYNTLFDNFAGEPLNCGTTFDTRMHIATIYNAMLRTTPRAPMYRSVWMDGTEVAIARSKGGSGNGLQFAVKGGYNDESHNHNDVGTFILYANGQPMIVDAGVGTYVAKTFSNRRYEIWTMQSEYHNLPVINERGQSHGAKFRSRNVIYSDNGRLMTFSLDIAGAYPTEAACRSWVRAYQFDRAKGRLQIKDTHSLERIDGTVNQNFLTCAKVTSGRDGRLELEYQGNSVLLEFNPSVYTLSIEEVTIDDPRLTAVWSKRLTRLTLAMKRPTLKGTNLLTFTQIK